jgi:hypothetical protein
MAGIDADDAEFAGEEFQLLAPPLSYHVINGE